MEVASALLGVCTRSRTLVLQRMQRPPGKGRRRSRLHRAPEPGAVHYLKLRSRRLEKPYPQPSKEKEASASRRTTVRWKAAAAAEEFKATEVAKWAQHTVPKRAGLGRARHGTVCAGPTRPSDLRSRPKHGTMPCRPVTRRCRTVPCLDRADSAMLRTGPTDTTHLDGSKSTFCNQVCCCVAGLLTVFIQPPLISTFATDLFLLLTKVNRLGARAFGASPPSQRECQNFALFPSPSTTTVDVAKSCLSDSSHGSSVFFFCSAHSFQSHPSLRALSNQNNI